MYSLMLGVLRIKQSPFIELFKDEITNYLNLTVKQTIVEFIAHLDDDSDTVTNPNEEINIKMRALKIQEFLLLLSQVLKNVKTMLGRVSSITNVILDVLSSAANAFSAKSNQQTNSKLDVTNTSSVNIGDREIISAATHAKLSLNSKEIVPSSIDYAQERLVNLLEAKFKDKNGIEKLTINDFISLTNLIEQFIVDFDTLANKKTATLRSWIQNQANKFLQKFHNERKEKLS